MYLYFTEYCKRSRKRERVYKIKFEQHYQVHRQPTVSEDDCKRVHDGIQVTTTDTRAHIHAWLDLLGQTRTHRQSKML